MVKILGARVDQVDMVQSLCHIQQYIELFHKDGRNHHVITLNAEIIYQAQSNAELMKVINAADLVTPDGAGVLWAAQKLGQPLKERVTGIDLMTQICKQAYHNKWRIYLLGGKPNVAAEAAEGMKDAFPSIDIAGCWHGYFDEQEEEMILADINSKQPDVLFVALGAPRQEFWIQKHRGNLKAGVMIGVGGSFDVMAGHVRRAPLFFQRMHLEWLWRLLSDPRRIKRMMALPKFMLLVQKSKWQKEEMHEEKAVEKKSSRKKQLP